MKHKCFSFNRRRLIKSALAGSVYASGLVRYLPVYAQTPGYDLKTSQPQIGPVQYELAIRREHIEIAGTRASATTVNQSIPGPLLELHEGQEAVLRVTNHLDEDSSIHWHGILLPFDLDGVPGVAFPGIKPGETFEARFLVRQSGTYWYHSHSGMQEQTGVYGPIVIHSSDTESIQYDRDYIVMLSDWTFENPHHVMSRLKKMSDYYNFNQPTVQDMVSNKNSVPWLDWARMRMNPTDIADVTGHTYTYLMNGLDATHNWTGLFNPDERIRLRFINAAAMTYFNIRIPGLPMTVIQADGQNVQPVETDEFQLGVAETLDVVVQPTDRKSFTLFAESMDRSGYVRGTLAPEIGMSAVVPPLRDPPKRSMIDMGMSMDSMEMSTDMHTGMESMPGMDHSMHQMSDMPEIKSEPGTMEMSTDKHTGMSGSGMESMPGMDHSMHQMADMSESKSEPDTMEMNMGGPIVAYHNDDSHGPGNISVAEVQRNRLGEPGTGLENLDHRVLVYTDLKSTRSTVDTRPPTQTIELHLTGNMERYMWSFDGKKYSQAKEPIQFNYGERIRLILVNDTMMEHPIHLHGMFMELENGHENYLPRKHTISVKPAERMSLLITADEPGRWAFHCHFLYHMDMGMFRVVEVS